ncbi:MAG: hypothetical protein ACFFCW_28870 [Candidatus Hodarchaeota archaeon]
MKRISLRCLSVVFSIVMIFVIFSTEGYADRKSSPDQQQLNEIGWYIIVGDGQEVAQTFSPGLDGYLTQVSVMLNKQMGLDQYTGKPLSPGNIIVEIRTTIGDDPIIPSDNVLASAILAEVAVSEGILELYDIFFPNPPPLYTGESYAIVLRTDQTIPPDPMIYPGGYRWHMDADHVEDPYPFGDMMARSQGTGDLWYVSDYWNEDATFITYMLKLKGKDRR